MNPTKRWKQLVNRYITEKDFLHSLENHRTDKTAMIEFHAINPFHSSKCRTYFDVPTYWFNSFHFLVTKGIENTFWQESAWYSKAPILVYRKRHDQGQCLLSSFIHWDACIELPETRHTWRLYGFEHRRITSFNLILWRIGRMSVKWVRIC